MEYGKSIEVAGESEQMEMQGIWEESHSWSLSFNLALVPCPPLAAAVEGFNSFRKKLQHHIRYGLALV